MSRRSPMEAPTPARAWPTLTDAELAALPDDVADELSLPLRQRRAAALRLVAAIRSQPGVEVRPAQPPALLTIDKADLPEGAKYIGWRTSPDLCRSCGGYRGDVSWMGCSCPPREFRAKLGKLKPGSLTAEGAIIDHRGIETERGPCFVPFDALSPARKGLMGEAGWHMERRPGKWPEIPPSRRHACIVRILP